MSEENFPKFNYENNKPSVHSKEEADGGTFPKVSREKPFNSFTESDLERSLAPHVDSDIDMGKPVLPSMFENFLKKKDYSDNKG
ncbi:MAG: hypothetical protein ACD_18C00301G0002 [uncultured bacterium]|nr:MAG: hypothetical protein ACD_18C00301G0002 [uncultured bacterium]